MTSKCRDFFASRARSFSHAFDGLAEAFRGEINFRIHCAAAVFAVFCGFVFKISALEWIAVILVIGMVVTAELINSAVERSVDLYSRSFSALAKEAKDLAAGAVLFSAVVSVIVGLIIFLPKVLAWLQV